MGLYADQVLPRLIDVACGGQAVGRWRAEAVAGLSGRVVEIGFGSGLNQPYYPPEVAVVLAVEPAALARSLAERHRVPGGPPVEHVGLDGQSLPLGDASCDAALSTFTLCTVPDPSVALVELRRVLKPGGALHFLEHGVAPDASVARWQHRLDPLQHAVAGGCRLTRDVPSLVASAGFDLVRCEQRYAQGPKPWSWFSVGVATSPGPAHR